MIAAVVEISGLPATLLLLAPLIVLLIVIVRLRRPPPPRQPERRPERLPTAAAAGKLPPDAPRAAATAPAPPAERRPAVDWAERIRAAEAASDHAALPELHLGLARAEIGKGRPGPAAEHLRSSVGLAARGHNAAVQAEARLELAELARAGGDLTTACEHWQLARALFYELKNDASLGETERLMQKHGCPTDWVLNDF